MTTLDDTTVTVSTDVDAPITRAFQVFTDEIGTWWDESHHLLQAPLAEMVFEPFVGGHIIDRGVDGSECRWSRVLAYEPPSRVVFSWDITTRWELETDPERCSEVEIAFTELSPTRTRVTLTHRHLDRHGEGWEQMRDAVARGWRLDGYAGRIDASNTALGRPLPQVSDEDMRARLGGAASYAAVLLHKTDAYRHGGVDRLIWEHGRRNMRLVSAGLLSIVCPVGDDPDLAGIAIFATSVEGADEIMRDDQAVRAGVFTYTVCPVRGFPGSSLP